MQCNAMQCNAMQWNAMQCNAMQCNAMQCNAIQCNEMQCNAMQCNAMQCNLMCKAMQCNAMQCNAMQCHAMQCNAMQCNTIQYNTIQVLKKNPKVRDKLGFAGQNLPPHIHFVFFKHVQQQKIHKNTHFQKIIIRVGAWPNHLLPCFFSDFWFFLSLQNPLIWIHSFIPLFIYFSIN